MRFVSASYGNIEETIVIARDEDGNLHQVPATPTNADFRLIDQGDPDAGISPIAIAPVALDEVKRVLRERINSERDALNEAPITFGGHEFDGDARAQKSVQGAYSMATLALVTSQSFSVDWVLLNNAIVTLDANAVIGLGQALAARTSYLIQTARTMKDAVEAATTRADAVSVAEAPRGGATASSSSRKRMQGAERRAFANTAVTAFSLSPR